MRAFFYQNYHDIIMSSWGVAGDTHPKIAVDVKGILCELTFYNILQMKDQG